jgi:hypothetical protein
LDQNNKRIPLAGFAIAAWCRAVGISRATYYNLPSALQPSSVKIGKRRIIREAPAQYLSRISQESAK